MRERKKMKKTREMKMMSTPFPMILNPPLVKMCLNTQWRKKINIKVATLVGIYNFAVFSIV